MNEETIKESSDLNQTIIPKKKGKGLKRLFIFLLVLAIIIIALAKAFPGLLWARSLNVSYSKKDYESVLAKLEIIKDAAPTTGEASDYNYVYGPLKNVEVTFTSEEITAYLNENRPDYYAIKNVEVRINDDGSIETVAKANVDYFLNEVFGGKYSRENIKKEMPALGLLPNNVNLYLKLDGNITNNAASINVTAASIQGIPIPGDLLATADAKSFVNDGANNMLDKNYTKSKTVFENVRVEDNKIIFKGTIPSSLERISN